MAVRDRRRKGLIARLVVAAGLVIWNPWPSPAEEPRLPGLGSPDTPWQVTADRLTYKEGEGIFEAEGEVVIRKDDQVLQSGKAAYSTTTGRAEVSGGVRLESGGDVFSGEAGVFDLKEQTGRIENGHLFLRQNNYHLRGRLMEKTDEDTYLIEGARLTTCDGENPDWSISGSKVQVTVDGYGTVRDAAFRVRGWPLLYVPYLVFPAKTKRQTGLLPLRIGLSQRNGLDTEVPFFWAISDRSDATFYQRYLEKRGYMQGLEFRYLTDEDSGGAFLFDILSDRRGEKDLTDPDEIELGPEERTNRDRYWFRGRADQGLPLGLEARLDADYVSDQDYLREFESGLFGLVARPDLAGESRRPVEEKRSPTRRSALRIHRDFDQLSLQLSSSYHQLPEDPAVDDTPQSLAGMSLSWVPQKVGKLPGYLGADSDYDYIWRQEGRNGHRFSVSPEYRLPLWLGRHVELEPWAGYSATAIWMDEEPGEDRNRLRNAYELGLRLSTRLERIFDVNWGGASRLKHRLWPQLIYRYRDDRNAADRADWFEPLDAEGDLNEIVFGLENFLDARTDGREGAVRYRQWVNFKLRQAYDLAEARRDDDAAKEPFRPLAATLVVTPGSNLYLRADAGWDHYAAEFSAAALSGLFQLPRSGNRLDAIQVDYRYSRDGQKSLNLKADVNLPGGFSVGGALERDLEVSAEISSGYWLDYRSQCWGVRVGAEREDDDTKFTVMFNLLGLGEFRAY